MDRPKHAVAVTPQEYFGGELRELLRRHQIAPLDESVLYLIDLLTRSIEADKFFPKDAEGRSQNVVLADLYAEAIKLEGPAREVILRKMGDLCLMVSGFFAESVQRKMVDLDYYFGMGGTAYQTLSEMQAARTPRQVFAELSEKFRPLSNVLGELSERSGLQNNQDLLRLYERWVFTGSERLRGLLTEQGIVAPLRTEKPSKH